MSANEGIIVAGFTLFLLFYGLVIVLPVTTPRDPTEYHRMMSLPFNFCSVQDKPSKPEGPLQVLDVYRDRCRLTWKPPVDDGGLPVQRYIVEAQDMETQKWVRVGKVMGDTQCGVPGLQPGKKYQFRVKAINAEGESEPLMTSSEVLAKDPFGEL